MSPPVSATITSAVAWLMPGMVSSRSRAPRKGAIASSIQVGTREHIFPTNPCNLFHIRSVRVYMYAHVLDMQAQSGQLVPHPVLLGLAEPQGLHVLREDRLGYDTVHGGMP